MEYQIGENYVDTRGTRIARKGKRVFLRQYSRPSDVGTLTRYVRAIFNNPETKTLIVDIQEDFRVFPNQIVPLACVIEYLRKIGKKVIIHNEFDNICRTRFDDPVLAENDAIQSRRFFDGFVWKVTSAEQCYSLVSAVISDLSHKVHFASGILHGLEWTLNEVIDNVLLHSNSRAAYFMYQPQLSSSGRLSFSIGDAGQGFKSSFQYSQYNPPSEADAITLAVKKELTRDPSIGAGNGLWGTLRIVGENGGRLTIASGGSVLFFRTDEGVARCYEGIGTVDDRCKTSLVDIQVAANRPIELARAFEQEDAPVSLFFEDFEDESGANYFSFKDWKHGTGTRESGRRARTLIANVLSSNRNYIILDFDGLGIISTSFADEVVGRLLAQLGRNTFAERVRVTGLNDVTRMILTSVLKSRGLEG